MELLNFITQNENWKELIQQKPYYITVKEDSDYILLMYSQIDSDFSLQLVRECRGIILRKNDYKIVCFPFLKFFNAQEGHASNIDWSSVRVLEKMDGSILKIWNDNGKWHISTNGTIHAANASLQMAIGNIENYHDLFITAVNFQYEVFDRLDINKTYIFELVSPYNKVVVPYSRTEIWHIGTRDNNTFEECDDDIGIQKPNEYNLRSIDECLQAAEKLPFSEEGYVIVDKNFNRIKVKGLAYVSAHHLKNNGVITMTRIVDMIKSKGQDDFLSFYPEYQEVIEDVENHIKSFIEKVNNEMDTLPYKATTRKEFALWAKDTVCPSYFFGFYDGRYSNPKQWLWDQQSDKILEWIGL